MNQAIVNIAAGSALFLFGAYALFGLDMKAVGIAGMAIGSVLELVGLSGLRKPKP
jgi:hypothetical protein